MNGILVNFTGVFSKVCIRRRPWKEGVMVDHRTVGKVISEIHSEDCLQGMFLHEEVVISLRPLQASWNKMDAGAAMLCQI